MQRLRDWFSRRKAAEVQAPGFMRVGLGPYVDLPGLGLPDAQEELYQRLSWVYAAVTITAQTAAGAPFSVMQLRGERQEAIENHPFELLLRRPNPLQSRQEFLEALIGFRQLTGNAYIWLNRSSETAPPSELWLIPPHQIQPVPDRQLYIRGYEYDPGSGQHIVLQPWEICHMKRFHPRNQFVGLSPVEALAVTATNDLAMAKWNANFFDKRHAKPAGALAFADPINDSDWALMQRDVERQYGGTERRMMMLRNAGKSGVSWLQMGINQKDMEFLAGRTFNKEEIFAAFAPGLSSMLAVNATEANSLAGKATFLEMTIWPMHTAIAEKITNDLLPAYGDNLVGEFDDVRIADRALQLQEQTVSYKLLTVKEAREKYYNLGPLGDERDDQLVEGVTQEPPASFEPLFSAAPSSPAPQQTLALPEPDRGEGGNISTLELESPIRADLLKWQRKASKRVKGGSAALCDFESDYIPDSLKAAIEGALETAQDVPDVRRIFGSLDWVGFVP